MLKIKNRPFYTSKTSHLQTALFNNVLGLAPKTTGKTILENGLKKLTELYPHIDQIVNEKVLEIKKSLKAY